MVGDEERLKQKATVCQTLYKYGRNKMMSAFRNRVFHICVTSIYLVPGF